MVVTLSSVKTPIATSAKAQMMGRDIMEPVTTAINATLRKTRNVARPAQKGHVYIGLRPHGKRKYFLSKHAALGEAQIQRTRLRNEGLKGFEFTLEQRTDAKMAMAVLAGNCLSSATAFH